MQDFGTADGFATDYPEGLVTLGGVEFAIPEGGLNTWSAAAAGLLNNDLPVSIDVAVGAFGVSTAQLLLTTHKGERLPGSYAMLEFIGSSGAYYAKPLDGDDDIRDWLLSEYTNTNNGTSTVEVFSAGRGYQTSYRLDMITVELPTEFRTQTLKRIRVSDWGNYELQRINVHGVSVVAVPEPSSYILSLMGSILIGLNYLQYKRRRRHKIPRSRHWPALQNIGKYFDEPQSGSSFAGSYRKIPM
jgi:hypothetical protein